MAKEKAQEQEKDYSNAKELNDIDLRPKALIDEKRSRRANFLFRPTVYAALELDARIEGVSCNALIENSLLAMLRQKQKQERKDRKEG